MNTVSMRAPSRGVTTIYSSQTLQTYTANANGFAVVDPVDVPVLLAAGWTVGNQVATKLVVSTDTAAFTAVAAQISGAAFVALNMTGNIAADRALTLPTVADLVAAIPGVQAGDSFMLRVLNPDASNKWTMTTNTGWTLSGTMDVAATKFRDFLVNFTSLTAATLTSVGSGTAD